MSRKQSTERKPRARDGIEDQLKRELKQRTMDLAIARRKLKTAVAKREAVEESLRQKELCFSRLLTQSRIQQGQLRQLSRKVIFAQEEERKRISRELHDVIAQMLTGINIRLETLRAEAAVNTKGLAKSILRTQKLVEKSVDLVHQFARKLRPGTLDDLGLIPTLYSSLTEFTKATGIRVSLTAFSGVEDMDSVKRTTLYRIAQEALSNIARHAKATSAEVIIEKVGGNVRMLVKDNGKAFDVEHVLDSPESARRLGLLGMRERAEMVGGSLTLESSQGHGTTVKAQFPFEGGVKGKTAVEPGARKVNETLTANYSPSRRRP